MLDCLLKLNFMLKIMNFVFIKNVCGSFLRNFLNKYPNIAGVSVNILKQRFSTLGLDTNSSFPTLKLRS